MSIVLENVLLPVSSVVVILVGVVLVVLVAVEVVEAGGVDANGKVFPLFLMRHDLLLPPPPLLVVL